MVLILLLVIAVLITPCVQASELTITSETVAKIDAYVSEMVKISQIPGASLAVVVEGQTILAKGYGISDLETRSPVTPDTIYGIGSITKSFTALAILQLRDQRLLELDAPVQRYLPWFRVADEQASEAITIRHLLNHTSGLPGNSHGLVWKDPNVIRPSIEQGVRALKDVHLRHPVGTAFEYANMGYATLGLIIEKLSGQLYEDYLQKHIFAPLTMSRSTADNDRLVELSDKAKPYWWPFGRLSESPLRMGVYMTPAGDMLLSSANDMARYVSLQLGYRDLISKSTLDEWHRGGVAVDTLSGNYQMGLFNSTIHDHQLVQHGGDATGSSTIMLLLPDDKVGVVLLMGAAAPQTPLSIGTGVLSIILGKEPPAKIPNNPWRVIGRISLMAAIAAIVLLVSLLYSWLGRRRVVLIPKWLVLSRAVIVPIVTIYGWFWVITTALSLGIPVPWGVYGWPVDIAIGFGSLLVSLTLWSVYSIVVAVGAMKKPVPPSLTR